MNIIIPLGGKGERFFTNGYKIPKPLIKIFEKTMIEHVIDNLNIKQNDKVFIIYNKNLDEYKFFNFIKNKYNFINLISIDSTIGPAETLYLGINDIIKNFIHNDKCLVIDCDTFYTNDIINIFENSKHNMVFYIKNTDPNPIYSYINLDEEKFIIDIKEKHKISDNANTGAYAFVSIHELVLNCKYILDNNIVSNNEPYTSCVISHMIQSNHLFKGYLLDNNFVFFLGTPLLLNKFITNTYAFLFDLDGTLVITDDMYYKYMG